MGEYPENEVRASHMDYALGFHRAPVSCSRNFTVDEIRKIMVQDNLLNVPDHRSVILDQMVQTCATSDGIFFGTMIGWREIIITGFAF